MSEQSLQALARANAVRRERKAVAARVRNGTMSLREALDHPATQSASVIEFVGSAAYSRRYYAHKRNAGIEDALGRMDPQPKLSVTVRELSAVRRDELARLVSELPTWSPALRVRQDRMAA